MSEKARQYSGTVKWFNNGRGYGFLGCEGREDVFVHFTAIEAAGYKTLTEGDEVEFEIAVGAKGKEQAERVRPVKKHG